MCCSWPCRRAVRGPSRRPRLRRCRRPRRPRWGPGRGTSGGRVPGGAGFGGAAGCLERAARARVERGDRSGRRRDARLGAGALVVVPDGRAAGRVDAALTALLGRGGTRCSPPMPGPRSGIGSGWPCGGGCAGGRRDPGRDVRAGPGSGARRDLGRRGRQSQRAARAAAACAGGAVAASRSGQVRVSVGELELHRRGRAAGRERVGEAVGRVAGPGAVGRAARTDRGDGDLARDEARSGRAVAHVGVAGRAGGAEARARAGAGAPAGVCAADGVRPVSGRRAVSALRGAVGGAGRGRAALWVVRGGGDLVALSRVRGFRLRAQIVGRGGPRRSWGGRFPRCRCGRPGGSRCSTPCRGRPRWW